MKVFQVHIYLTLIVENMFETASLGLIISSPRLCHPLSALSSCSCSSLTIRRGCRRHSWSCWSRYPGRCWSRRSCLHPGWWSADRWRWSCFHTHQCSPAQGSCCCQGCCSGQARTLVFRQEPGAEDKHRTKIHKKKLLPGIIKLHSLDSLWLMF